MGKKRVVITGLGIVASNATGIDNFTIALRKGQSGIKKIQWLEDLNFGCQIGGIPDISENKYADFLTDKHLEEAGDNVKYISIAGKEAWEDAGFSLPDFDSCDVDYDTGVVIGSGVGSIDVFSDKIFPHINEGHVRKLRSNIAEFTMFSAPGANLSGLFALGNQVTANSSACSTGNESIINAFDRIREGKAQRMLAGSCEIASPYVWGCFDSMRLLSRKSNNEPEKGSRPMSATASGFVPGSGAGIIVLEELNSALSRNAKIYGEILGGFLNSGGQRNGGTMQAPGPNGIQNCITNALKDASVNPYDIDYISGHLSSTMADPLEIKNWCGALNRYGKDFPYINSLKSLTGHGLGAAGTLETIAAILEMYHGFLFPSINCEDPHPNIIQLISPDKIPHNTMENINIEIFAKASFGFGDINSCIIIGKYKN